MTTCIVLCVFMLISHEGGGATSGGAGGTASDTVLNFTTGPENCSPNKGQAIHVSPLALPYAMFSTRVPPPKCLQMCPVTEDSDSMSHFPIHPLSTKPDLSLVLSECAGGFFLYSNLLMESTQYLYIKEYNVIRSTSPVLRCKCFTLQKSEFFIF